MKLALLAAVAAAASPTPHQFDLLCKGNNTTVHYRVDLDAQKWCWDSCSSTSKIERIEPTKITFKEGDTPSQKFWNWVDRATGEWSQGLDDRRLGYMGQSGVCQRASFSGFPATPATQF